MNKVQTDTAEFSAKGLDFFSNPQCPDFNDLNYYKLLDELKDDTKTRLITPQQMIAVSTWLNVCAHVIGVIS